MSEQNWWRTAATAGFTVTAGIGIAAALYAIYNEYENQQNQQRLGYYNSSRANTNQNRARRLNDWNYELSQEDSRRQLEKERELIELREKRQKQLKKEQQEKEERERERRSLEATRKRLEKEQKLREERQKQLESDQRIKREEEEKIRKKTQEMESMLDSFDDEFDSVIGVSTKKEYIDEDFDDWSNNKKKQQRKEEYRRKQQAKHLESQNGKEKINKFNNVVVHVTNKSCDTEQNQFTNLDHVIDSSDDTSQIFEEANDFRAVGKPRTEAQKAARRQKKKLRRQRKRLENTMKSLNLENGVGKTEDK